MDMPKDTPLNPKYVVVREETTSAFEKERKRLTKLGYRIFSKYEAEDGECFAALLVRVGVN